MLAENIKAIRKQRGMTQEEYNEMYERIRAELMEELMQIYGEVLKEQQNGAKTGTSE